MGLDENITKYFELESSIHLAFGYKESWKVIPLNDNRMFYWMIVGNEQNGSVVYSEQPFTQDVPDGGCIYSASIYTQRFLPQYVYRTPTHVMVSADTNVDGNKFLMLFDAQKECTDEAIKKCYVNKMYKM